MKPMRMLILLAVTWVAGTLLFAAETQPPTPAPATPPATTPATPAPKPSEPASAPASAAKESESASAQKPSEVAAEAKPVPPKAAGEEELPPLSPTDAEKRPSPQRFVPSEQVRADFDVSFPIDI